MDKETRNRIKNTVLDIRRLLERDVGEQLEGRYGIARSGRAQPLSKMLTLQEDAVLYHRRMQIDDVLQHNRDAGLSAREAVAHFIHETAYTALNRLVAVKMLEARGLLRREGVSEGRESAGFKDFQKVCPQVCQAQPDGGYQLFLEMLFDELASSIRPLFDRGTPHSIIFPRWTTLSRILHKLNDYELAEVWTVDETIGWVYQYFNKPDRRTVRQGGSPERPEEVAVLNQFYTPRYVVEFLVDNTLGKLWVEMRQGKTRLTQVCTMLVRRPDEPIAPREPKDPSEIKVLDPAVGSAHFLHYAFDLLVIMYEESGYDPAEIPALILQNNLFGIDIDPRAVQLAAFTLYLRARTHEKRLGAPTLARLPTANLVIAEPMPGDKELFEEFLAAQSQAVQNVCSRIWDLLELAAEAGSLLKVEVAFDEAIASERERLSEEPLFDREGLLSGRTSQQRFKDHVVALFHDYYRRALAQADVERTLFAAEGEQGLRLLILLQQDYDVVLMNPPFTRTTQVAQAYINKQYDHWHNSLLCAFVIRALVFVRHEGLIGSVLDRSVLIKSSYQKFRDQVILQNSRLTSLVDLGWNVLDDADVEVSAFVLEKDRRALQPNALAWCVDITNDDVDAKQNALGELIELTGAVVDEPRVYWADPSDFSSLPNCVFGYYIPEFMRRAFRDFDELADHKVAFINGHTIKSDVYKRYFWEVKFVDVFLETRWSLMFNGGEYSPFYLPTTQITLYGRNGELIAEHPSTIFRNLQNHKKRGLCYGKRGEFLDVQWLRTSHVLTNEGFGAPSEDEDTNWYVLGLLNTPLLQSMINTYCGQHKGVGYVNLLPIPEAEKALREVVSKLAREAHDIKAEWFQGDETALSFSKPWILSSFTFMRDDLEESVEQLIDHEAELNERLAQIDRELHMHVLSLYRVTSSKDEEEVNHRTQKRPPLFLGTGSRSETREETQRRHAASLVSYAVGCICTRWDPVNGGPLLPENVIRQDNSELLAVSDVREELERLRSELGRRIYHLPYGLKANIRLRRPESGANNGVSLPFHSKEGMLVDDPGHTFDIGKAVDSTIRWLLSASEDSGYQAQICAWLETSSFEEYFRNAFFVEHLRQYRNRPIYWQLTTPSKSYSLWLYYHALGAETLYTAVQQYVTPKIEFEEAQLKEVRKRFAQAEKSGPAYRARQLEKTAEEKESLLQELYAFRSELRRLADWGYDPDLDDGVLINIAPLHRLVPWKEAEKAWAALEAGDYEWSAVARRLKGDVF